MSDGIKYMPMRAKSWTSLRLFHAETGIGVTVPDGSTHFIALYDTREAAEQSAPGAKVIEVYIGPDGLES